LCRLRCVKQKFIIVIIRIIKKNYFIEFGLGRNAFFTNSPSFSSVRKSEIFSFFVSDYIVDNKKK